MNSKNDKRLCWNCDGAVSHHLVQCPFCGADLSRPTPNDNQAPFQGFASPFQSSQQQQQQTASQQEVFKPPFSNFSAKDHAVSEEEWNQAVNKENRGESEEDLAHTTKRDLIALLLLLPGVVLFLFGLTITLFSSGGVLSLSWSQNLAYFYFLVALPLLYLGYRALR